MSFQAKFMVLNSRSLLVTCALKVPAVIQILPNCVIVIAKQFRD